MATALWEEIAREQIDIVKKIWPGFGPCKFVLFACAFSAFYLQGKLQTIYLSGFHITIHLFILQVYWLARWAHQQSNPERTFHIPDILFFFLFFFLQAAHGRSIFPMALLNVSSMTISDYHFEVMNKISLMIQLTKVWYSQNLLVCSNTKMNRRRLMEDAFLLFRG